MGTILEILAEIIVDVGGHSGGMYLFEQVQRTWGTPTAILLASTALGVYIYWHAYRARRKR